MFADSDCIGEGGRNPCRKVRRYHDTFAPSVGVDASGRELAARVRCETIERSHDELLICYLEAIQIWKRLAGRLVIDFTVQADGTVTDPAVAMNYSSILDPTVGCCIARVAQTWKFPAPPDNKPFQVTYPFDLMTSVGEQPYDAPKASTEYRGQFPGTLILAPSLAPNATDLRSVW